MKKFEFNGKKNICGHRIRELRIAKRMSQEALAIKMQMEGVILEQDVVSRIESGKRLVTDYEVLAFAAVLEISIDQLLSADSGQ